jgi:hexosaminidase
VNNNLAWLEVMKRESQGGYHINFRGIVLTGWSRYDHFAVLCELLPAAIPSLVLSLSVLLEGGHTVVASKTANRLLQCDVVKELMTQEELMRNPNQWDLYRCRYPGSSLFNVLGSYDMTRKEVDSMNTKVSVARWAIAIGFKVCDVTS